MENSVSRNEIEDPDYESVSSENKREHNNLSVQQQDAKEQAIQRIEGIIRQQFSFEAHLKQREIELIDNSISTVRAMLDRLRACVLAKYYGTSEQKGQATNAKVEKDDFSTRRSGRNRVKVVGVPRAGMASTVSSPSNEKLSTSSVQSQLETGDFSEMKRPLSAASNPTPVNNGNAAEFEFSHLKSSVETSVNVSESHVKICESPTPAKQGQSARISDFTRNLMSASRSQSVDDDSSVTQTCARISCSVESSSNITESLSSTIGNLSNVTGSLSSATGSPLNITGSQSSATGSPLNVTGSQSRAIGSQSNVARSQSSAIGSPSNAAGSLSSAIGSPSNVTTLSNATETPSNVTGNHSNAVPMSLTCTGSRFYVKKRIIVGNTSKYISMDMRENNDKSTHKWMVYVRGPPEDPHIDRFIKKVWFFLHPSYRPNDIVEVNKPPFHLTRRGWGEFPVRVQLHFVDPRNKRVDIIHELKLDRTYTGLQTLGAETVVDLELDRRTLGDSGIPFTLCREEESAPSNSTTVSVSKGQFSERIGSNRTNDEDATFRQHSSNLELTSQFPQLKKMKLESPISGASSGFSSAVSTPMTSLPTSRCSSPDLVSKNVGTLRKFPNEVEELLTTIVKEHPLIAPGRKNVMKHPYSASTKEQFLSWNIGKRRACEWQRAVAMRRHASNCMPSCKLSTREVMVWCRRFGFTPSEKLPLGEDVSFCKFCGGYFKKSSEREEEESSGERTLHGCCLPGNEPTFISFTPTQELLSAVEVKEGGLPEVPRPSDQSEDLEIDVVGDSPVEKKPTENDGLIKCSIPPTSEQNWIRDTCRDIGIKLKPLDLEGVDIHVVESLLLSACKRFAQDVLRHSAAAAADQTTSYGPRLVIPSHVHKAVCSLPNCDFLRNMYLDENAGKEKE